jgi:dipeptidyl aminopeptidase/acylaminoacyl peptidase
MFRPLILWIGLAVPLAAQPAAVRDRAITVDDYATLAAITQFAVSPDGTHVAYCEGRWDRAEDNRRTDLWVVSADGKGKPRRLTGERANDREPKWAADGKSVFVLANRKRAGETKAPYDGTAQVWRVALDGSDPKPVTRVAGGVAGYDYAPKADVVFYATDTSATDDDSFTKLRSKYANPEYGHGKRKTSEIHKLDLATWRAEKVVGEGRYVREFVVTDDGQRIAMVSAIDDTVVKSEGESRVDVWTGGKVVTPPTDAYRNNPKNSPFAWLENLCWNPDGTRFAFTAVHDAYPAEVMVGGVRDGTWKVERIDREGKWEVVGYGRGVGQPMKWSSPNLLWVMSEAKGRSFLSSLNLGSAEPARAVWNMDLLGFDFSLAANQPTIALHNPKSSLPTLYRGESTPVVDPNPHTAGWKLPSVEHVNWKAPDGTEVGGVLELPFGHKKGDKLPLVVAIHGGPTTSTKADLNYDPHNGRLYFAANGYAVLLPNYRGSTGYGDQFVTDLIGNENDIEVKDILAGIQHLIKEGIADPDRIGVMGWSNGGYLTNCLITLKDSPVKFKAASSGAGILDCVAEWGFNDEPAYPAVFKKGHPWETPDIYRKTSPTYGLGNVTTPTLIHVGGNDERCPPGHSRMLYRALKEYKKVPTELVVYTGEPHGLGKLSNRLAKMEWDLAWFDKYLKGNGK